jgi:hypothetical protein
VLLDTQHDHPPHGSDAKRTEIVRDERSTLIESSPVDRSDAPPMSLTHSERRRAQSPLVFANRAASTRPHRTATPLNNDDNDNDDNDNNNNNNDNSARVLDSDSTRRKLIYGSDQEFEEAHDIDVAPDDDDSDDDDALASLLLSSQFVPLSEDNIPTQQHINKQHSINDNDDNDNDDNDDDNDDDVDDDDDDDDDDNDTQRRNIDVSALQSGEFEPMSGESRGGGVASTRNVATQMQVARSNSLLLLLLLSKVLNIMCYVRVGLRKRAVLFARGVVGGVFWRRVGSTILTALMLVLENFAAPFPSIAFVLYEFDCFDIWSSSSSSSSMLTPLCCLDKTLLGKSLWILNFIDSC